MNEQQWASASQVGGLLATLQFLDGPARIYHRWMGHPITLKVQRYEFGLVERDIEEEGRLAILPAVRLHLDGEQWEQLGPYLDFTNRGLILQVAAVMSELMRKVREAGANLDARLALAVLPEGEDHVTIRLSREGERLDTRYKLELLEKGVS